MNENSVTLFDLSRTYLELNIYLFIQVNPYRITVRSDSSNYCTTEPLLKYFCLPGSTIYEMIVVSFICTGCRK